MGMPPIVFTSQHVTLYSPLDSAINVKSSGKQFEAYKSLKDLDVSKLKLKKGDQPVEFVVRALSPAEFEMVNFLVEKEAEPGMSETATALFMVQIWLHAIRFGLVSVTGLDGWEEAKRDRVNMTNKQGWTEDTIEAIDGQTRLFIGQAIISLTQLDEEKKSNLAAGASIKMESGSKNKDRKEGDPPV